MKSDTIVYAVWALNEDIRKKSTSGGVFTLFAKDILENGGVVYGAAFDEEMNVKHRRITQQREIGLLRGSKYVASRMEHCYWDVLKDLNEGRKVLFSGTPCEIAAIRAFTKNHPNLLCIDIICHGVPSPNFWQDYKTCVEKRYKSKIAKVNFRYKKPNWVTFSMRIELENGKIVIRDKRKDPYLLAFLGDYISRPSCHNCRFTKIEREGDITIADFWGIEPQNEYEWNYDKGVSVCMVNTPSGRDLFEKIKPLVYWAEHSIQESINGNRCLSQPYPPNENKETFLKDYLEKGYDYVVQHYLQPEKIPLKVRLRESEIIKPILGYWRRKKTHG